MHEDDENEKENVITDVFSKGYKLDVYKRQVEHFVGRIEEVNIAYAGKISPGAGEHIVCLLYTSRCV